MNEQDEEVENFENEEIFQETEDQNEVQTKKKGRQFYAKEFRQQLASKSAYMAIKRFVRLCSEVNPSQDYALEYLESGGGCIELVRVIEASENKSASSVVPVVEALTIVLLKIISSQPQKQRNGEESCRELLNKYFSIIKSMLSLSANNYQRKLALKLLATMVTLSPKLAKEVLALVFFDEPCLQILTNPSNVEDGNTVRTSFIHFLISFLVEEHSDVIHLFLQKSSMLQSIFPGLIYDTPNIVNVVFSTLQKNVLENTDLSKTLKMSIFGQKNIQTIINLYNWKGPKCWNPTKKKQFTPIVVDIEDKQLVCEITHQFLTILCTSRKFGVIFQDETLGSSTAKLNSLMSNVVKSLKKPWNNKYVSDLVINICSACPDLVKEVLADIETSLETRVSENWLNIVRFVKLIIENLDPLQYQRFLPKLNNKQLFTTIQTFCVPESVLKIIFSEVVVHDHVGIRHEGILLLLTMLNSLEKYLNVIDNLPEISPDNRKLLKLTLTNYLSIKLPPSSVLLKNWHKTETSISGDSIIPIPEYNSHLSLLLDVLYKYKVTCPELVDQITRELDTNEFLKTIDQLPTETVEMEIKAINLFISCDLSFFHPSKDLFSYSFPLLLKMYFESENNLRLKVEPILYKILNGTGIFEGCSDEIMIFLYSILELGFYNENVGIFFTTVFQDTTENFLKYNVELGLLKDDSDNSTTFSLLNWLKTLENNKVNLREIKLKHKIVSPLIVGLLNALTKPENSEMSSGVNTFLVHLLFSQTRSNIFTSLLLQDNYKLFCSKYLIKYCKNKDVSTLRNLKKLLISEKLFSKVFNFIFSDGNNFDAILNSSNSNIYHNTLLTNFIIYFYTQSILERKLEKSTQDKCLKVILYIINSPADNTQNCLNSILGHPVLLQTFSPTDDSKQTIENMCTDFVIQIIEELLKTKTKHDVEIYLDAFKFKLVRKLSEMLQNFNEETKIINTNKLMSIIRLFNFSFEQSSEIIKIISKLPYTCYVSTENNISIVPEILSFILNKNFGYLNTFEDEIIKQIGLNIQKLNNFVSEVNFDDLENSLCLYINRYPCVNKNFDVELFNSLITKSNINKSSIKLATNLVKYNKNLVTHFESNLDSILEKRELVLSVLNTIKDIESSEIVMAKVYKEYEQIILKFVNKPQKVSNYLMENYKIIAKLVNDYLSIENCNKITSKIQKYDVSEHYHCEVLITIFNKSITAETDEQKKIKIVTNFIITMMYLLTNILKRNEKSETDWMKIENISKDFHKYIIKIKNVYKINYTDETIYKNAAFQNFSKLCLKFGLQNNPVLIKLLNRICALTTENNPELGTIFEMAISHSESLNILLSNNDLKAPLLSLLLIICKKCPTVMAKSHIPVWLGSYGATLSESDQYLLQLLNLYEKADIGFHEYRPYLWGPAAVGHYSVRSERVNNLWRQPKPKDVLDLLNEDIVKNTVLNFPQSRQLRPTDSLYSASELEVYDPAFYLPLLSHILAPESTVRWYNVTNRGTISLLFICLTSESEETRSAACHVLARFHSHVEAAQYAKQRLLWQHLVELFCRGTSTLENLRISSPVAIFMCRCVDIFTRPDNLLYKPISNYILAKQTPNYNVVPELLEMFFNTSVDYKIHRVFILTVIRDGLKSKMDLEIIFRCMIFKLIMDLYNSTLSNFESKNLILQILSAAVKIQNGSQILINSYSLLAWLHTVLHQISSYESDLLMSFIDILNNLVTHTPVSRLKHNKQTILLIQVSAIDILKNMCIDLNHLVKFVKILYFTYERRPDIINQSQLRDLLNICSKFVDCNKCDYYLKFGIEYTEQPVLISDDSENLLRYYIELLTLKWIEANNV